MIWKSFYWKICANIYYLYNKWHVYPSRMESFRWSNICIHFILSFHVWTSQIIWLYEMFTFQLEPFLCSSKPNFSSCAWKSNSRLHDKTAACHCCGGGDKILIGASRGDLESCNAGVLYSSVSEVTRITRQHLFRNWNRYCNHIIF